MGDNFEELCVLAVGFAGGCLCKRCKRVSNSDDQEAKKENIEKVVVIFVNQKSYCVTSYATRDMLCYFVRVMNFNSV